MKDLTVGKKRWGNGQNDNVSHATPNSLIRLRGDNVTLNIPVQKPSDKEEIIEKTLKTIQKQISQMPTDRLSNTIDLIVREVEGHAVVGARTGADTKLLIIQEIDKAIKQVESLLGQEQNKKMQKFYQNLISALQEKRESVYDALNPAQIAKLEAEDSAQIAKLEAVDPAQIAKLKAAQNIK